MSDSLRHPSKQPKLSLLQQQVQTSPEPAVQTNNAEVTNHDIVEQSAGAPIEPLAERIARANPPPPEATVPESAQENTPKDAFVAQLFEEQAVPLVKYLTARFRNAAEAQDIAQEAWLRIFRLENPEQLSNAKAFLFQTASNLAIDRARRGKLEQKYLDQELGLAEPALAPSMERTIAGTEQLELVEQALLRLPLKCRQAFVAHRSRGLPYAEIARQLGVSTSMVEKYIIQALRHLRSTLK